MCILLSLLNVTWVRLCGWVIHAGLRAQSVAVISSIYRLFLQRASVYAPLLFDLLFVFLAHLTQPFKMKPKQESEHLLQTLHVKSVGKRTTQKIMGWKWHQYSWWWNLIFNWMTITMNVCVCLCVCADVPFSTIFYIGFTVTEHNRTHLINLLFCFSVVVDIPVAWNRCHFMLNDSIPWPL